MVMEGSAVRSKPGHALGEKECREESGPRARLCALEREVEVLRTALLALIQEKVGALSYAENQNPLDPAGPKVGTITLGPSTLAIGADVRFESGSVSVRADLAEKNKLYYVYVDPDGGSGYALAPPTPRPPSRMANSRLVGAYYTNGRASDGFGSFVSIEGTPTSGWIEYQPVRPPDPAYPIASKTGWWRRVGDSIDMRVFVDTKNVSPDPAAGQNVAFSTPTNLSIKTSSLPGYHYDPTKLKWVGATIRRSESGTMLLEPSAATVAIAGPTELMLAYAIKDAPTNTTFHVEATSLPITGFKVTSLARE